MKPVKESRGQLETPPIAKGVLKGSIQNSSLGGGLEEVYEAMEVVHEARKVGSHRRSM